jgi:5-hydroxyisourate hydrolase
MGRLTTHVLDTAAGRPAAGLRLTLFRVNGDQRASLIDATTNIDGRCDAPLLEGEALAQGTYELVFQVGAYFGHAAFLGAVPVRFRVADPSAHYHVPLLVTPFGYTTYRGS